MDQASSVSQQIDKNGFAVALGMFGQQQTDAFKHSLAGLADTKHIVGVRDLITKSPEMLALAQSRPIRQMVEPILGKSAAVVRSIFFNKSLEANWQVAWHQDVTIAVQQKADLPGFDGWSLKDHIPHVQAPTNLLARMLTVRIHLDPADETNGALWVIPQSHALGRIPANQAADIAGQRPKQLCPANTGDVVLFRPLILHASKKALSDRPRRVIHFEFAAAPLPWPLQWWEWVR